MGILTKWSEHELFQELLFRQRVERSELPNGSPWFDLLVDGDLSNTKLCIGEIYFFAVLAWHPGRVLPDWKVDVLRWGRYDPTFGWISMWTHLDGLMAFPHLRGWSIIEAFPRVLCSPSTSFEGCPSFKELDTDDYLYQACSVAHKNLNDWVLQLNPPAE